MKLYRIYLLLIFTIYSLPQIGNAQILADTISNWQIYKDSELMIKSHIVDSKVHNMVIEKIEKYNKLILYYNYDIIMETIYRQVKFEYGKKTIVVYENNEQNTNPINIPKIIVDQAVDGYYNKPIAIIYSDSFSKNETLIGFLEIRYN